MVVEGVLKTEGVGDRQVPAFGEGLQGLRGRHRPSRTARDDQRSLSTQERRTNGLNGLGVGRLAATGHARQRLGHHGLGQHVLGQDQHHRAGSALQGGGKGPRHVLGDARRVVDALHPLGHALGAGAKEGGEVHFLEGFAVARIAGHIAHEQNQGRAVLVGRVHADRGVGGPRPSGDETHAWAARELAVRLGHEGRAPFLAVAHPRDAIGVGVKAVEHGQKAFAGHAKRVRDALFDQALHQTMAGQLGGVV